MSRHEPDEDGRCRASDLLPRDCAGCRGSDTTFVDALLASEPEPDEDYGEQDRDPEPDEELAARALRPVERDPFWLNTGPADPKQAARLSRPFPAHYSGGKCPLCPRGVFERQMIVKTNLGYAHSECLEER